MTLGTDQYVPRSLELYGEYCPEEWRMFWRLPPLFEIGPQTWRCPVKLSR